MIWGDSKGLRSATIRLLMVKKIIKHSLCCDYLDLYKENDVLSQLFVSWVLNKVKKLTDKIYF